MSSCLKVLSRAVMQWVYVLVVLCYCTIGCRTQFLIKLRLSNIGQVAGDAAQNGTPHKCYALCSREYTEEGLLCACQRGCRLLNIQLSLQRNNKNNDNNNLQQCNSNCGVAYTKSEELQACKHGCDTQLELATKVAPDDGHLTPVLQQRRHTVIVRQHRDGQLLTRSRIVLDDGARHVRIIDFPPQLVSHIHSTLPDTMTNSMIPHSVQSIMQYMHNMMQRLGFDNADKNDVTKSGQNDVTARQSILEQLMGQQAHDVVVVNPGGDARQHTESRESSRHVARGTWSEGHVFTHCLRVMAPRVLLCAALVAVLCVLLWLCCMMLVARQRRLHACLLQSTSHDSINQLTLVNNEETGEMPPKYIPQHLDDSYEKKSPPPSYLSVDVSNSLQERNQLIA